MKTLQTQSPSAISRTCEVLAQVGPFRECGLPTTHAYPAMGGGFMALCAHCAKQHIKHGGAISTDELIKNGEKWA